MVSQGTVTAEEGVRLLDALHEATPGSQPYREGALKWFRVRVTDLETGRSKVNVNLPLGLVKVGVKIGGKFAPEMGEVDWDEVMTAIQEGASGKLVDVEDIEDGEKVEVFVE
jgi:hypothetical protein